MLKAGGEENIMQQIIIDFSSAAHHVYSAKSV